MKLLTVTVPCYNSSEYMKKCVDSLLIGGEDVEIIIVNDGSKDQTLLIANEYQEKYPTIVRVIDKANGGHGSAVNVGMEHAGGLYFKVVDSDDWVREEAYREILDTLGKFGGENKLDMLISNFVYEKQGVKKHKVMRYGHALPKNELFEWKDIRHFRKGQYMLMHSVIFRTKLLRECHLKLPEHTFYVDNLFVFMPLIHVKKMYYLDVNFYRYFIGREGQSIHEDTMVIRIDQQLLVNKLMVDYLTENKTDISGNRKLYKYMLNFLEIITTVSSIMLIRSGTKENLEKKKELWNYIKKKDWILHKRLRYGLLGNYTNLPGRGGRRISVEGYKLCKRFFKFN